MAQINNKLTGQEFVLERISKTNAVFYDKNDSSNALNVPLENLETTILEQAKSVLGVDYEVSDKDYNWVYPKSAENVDTAVRLTIPSSIVNEDPNSDISELILNLASTYDSVSVKLKFQRITYLTTISTQFIDILEPSVLDGTIKVEELVNGDIIVLHNLDKYKN